MLVISKTCLDVSIAPNVIRFSDRFPLLLNFTCFSYLTIIIIRNNDLEKQTFGIL